MQSESYFRGPLQAKYDLDNDFRKKLRGFAQEVDRINKTGEQLAIRKMLDEE